MAKIDPLKSSTALVRKVTNNAPVSFKPPVVKSKSQGIKAFHSYDWYFNWLSNHLENVDKIFLTPCAKTKPIYTSPLHRRIYQKYNALYQGEYELLVVSEPVVLIRYQDLYDLEKEFCYDFPPKLLDETSRGLFIQRLNVLLEGKEIIGCLPKHHERLINYAIGKGNWENLWRGDVFSMMRREDNRNFKRRMKHG